MCVTKGNPALSGEQPHIGLADALDLYHARVLVKRMHKISGHLDFCKTCDDFYAAARAHESAA